MLDRIKERVLDTIAKRLGLYTGDDLEKAVFLVHDPMAKRIEELEQLLERQRRKPAPPVAHFTSEPERLREVEDR